VGARAFTVPLTLTSQFAFCGLPLRLDTYGGCAFQCKFCFARYRGGATAGEVVRPADPASLERVFARALKRHQPGILAQFLRRRVPLHFGGMSDPFQPAERRHLVTRSVLKLLGSFQYPTVISTRSELVAERDYLSLLGSFPCVVQFSFSTLDALRARLVEPNCPAPSTLLKAAERLAGAGVPVTVRWQPYIPGFSGDPDAFCASVARAGFRHVAVEHLKVPVEQNHRLWRGLVEGLGRDLGCEYLDVSATRDGREFVLPADLKLPIVTSVRRAAHANGMTFGAADNELQYLSDTGCCCSGVDQFAGFENWYKFQIGCAIRRCRGSEITFESISKEWRPEGSIDRYLNSRSRLSRQTTQKGSADEHLLNRWNNRIAPGNPSSFYGVRPTERFDAHGQQIYQWSTAVAD
jgi:DNA repair photolyase